MAWVVYVWRLDDGASSSSWVGIDIYGGSRTVRERQRPSAVEAWADMYRTHVAIIHPDDSYACSAES